MRVLITGATGFVGRHLRSFAAERDAEIVGAARAEAARADAGDLDRYVEVDLLEADAALELIATEQPDRVFHLAAAASVSESWGAPAATIETNLTITLNLLEAIRRASPRTRVLVACSGDAYGPVEREGLPVREGRPLRPQSPYALSKAAIDLLAGFYADAYDLSVLRARSFNHAGPGQSDTYAVSSFAQQIAEARARGERSMELLTGNLDVARDFSDVRDAVRAYWLLLERAGPGAYNVCSGRSVKLSHLVQVLAEVAGVQVRTRTDPGRLRDAETMDIYGSHERLSEATGWKPEIPLEATLADTLEHWSELIGGVARG